MASAKELTAALGGVWTGHSGIARCPAHRDRVPSLSLANGNSGRLLLHCFAGCDFASIISNMPAGSLEKESGPIELSPQACAQNLQRQRWARRLYAAATTLEGSLAEQYLRSSRCIKRITSENLRFHPSLRHPSGIFMPALVAAITTADGFAAVHRTWLAPPGQKTDAFPARAMLGPAAGGAVRLSDGSGPLIVAEGIETALSLRDAAPEDAAVWSALSASGLAGLELPPTPGELLIGADGDPTGLRAATTLATRASSAGWTVRIAAAPTGQDWNDVARGARRASA